MIDDLTTTNATGTNRSITTAQELKFPIAVEGACQSRSADFFKFNARKGERLSFEVVAQRIGSSLDPLVRLFDAKGHELVFCEDTPDAGVDCRFDYKFSKPGEYFLELRDTRYDGGSQYRYRLRGGSFASNPKPLPFQASLPSANPASKLPIIRETEPNESVAQPISIPASILGQFQKTKDRDCYEFSATNGQRLVFRGKTRSLGSSCDLYLRLENAEGKKVAEAPMTGADEGSLTNTFKESGSYRLIVEELAQLSGPEFFYRIDVEPYQSGFALSVDAEKVQAHPGGTFDLKVSPERREYDGPITLSLEGAGEGFSLEKNTITGKTNATTLTVRVPERVEPGQLIHFKITGHAEIGGREFSTTVSTLPALRKLFPHQPWPPPELDGWIALGVTEK